MIIIHRQWNLRLRSLPFKSPHLVHESELPSEANRMLSKPGYCRFETSSSLTLSVSVNWNMMINSLKSNNNDNNHNAEFTFVTGMKTKRVRRAAF